MDTLQSPCFTDKLIPEPSRVSDLDKGDIPRKDDHNIRVYKFLGYTIMVGQNALSNDTLIEEHKKVHPACLWFHAVCAKGGHVVLCWDGLQSPAEIVIRRAADYALKHSKAELMEVNTSPLIDVFKPDLGRPGVFRTWRTKTINL